jgi:aminomethyltransferase
MLARSMSTESLARLPLHARHATRGARFVPFAGYEMPVQYSAGVTLEHKAVRGAVGLFDVSHMGELFLDGEQAGAVIDRLVTNDVKRLAPGQALYTAACNEQGTILDDLIIYRLGDQSWMIVCNASNRAKIAKHVGSAASGQCSFADRSDDYALLALQGPGAEPLLRAVGAGAEVTGMARFGVVRAKVAGLELIAARTGYTGEDGFELFCATDAAGALWDALFAAGDPFGLQPIGLGARDTLRLEACLMLYGNDIDETTNPYEAGIGWTVKLDKGEFSGRSALQRIKAAPLPRKLVGFEMVGRGIARHDYPIVDAGGAPIGRVTSGAPSLSLGKNIGLGYVPRALAKLGSGLGIEIRGKVIEAVVVKTPFYQRNR